MREQQNPNRAHRQARAVRRIWYPGVVLITLLTDFGHADAYVGVMKGVIAGIAPEARVIDLCHGVAPQAVSSAGYLLATSAPFFPEGTLHVAVVDPGVGSERRVLCARTPRATYLAPDNGLLGPALERDPPLEVVSVENDGFFLSPLSSTFHGRDLFAPVAAHLALGTPLGALGPALESWLPGAVGSPRIVGDATHAEVWHVDHFGNLITTLPGRVGERWLLEVGEGRVVGAVQPHYSNPPNPGPILVRGSSGLLEVSVPGGSAADVLNVQAGARVVLRREPTEEAP